MKTFEFSNLGVEDKETRSHLGKEEGLQGRGDF